MSKLNQMILNFRNSKNQSVEAMAIMLNISIEDYIRLEKDWNPPDEVLKKISILFNYNLNDLKRASLLIPNKKIDNENATEKNLNDNQKSIFSFNQLVKKSRIDVGQTKEGISMMLEISLDLYNKLEDDLIPNDDLLKKICMLFSWNYFDIRNKLLTKNNPLSKTQRPPLSFEEIKLSSDPVKPIDIPIIKKEKTISQKIKEARKNISQTQEGMALLLQINTETYSLIESGEILPNEELLKKIASLFQWNYFELLKEDRLSRYSHFENHLIHLDYSNNFKKLNELLNVIKKEWIKLHKSNQKSLLVQIELIKNTILDFNNKKKT